MERETLVGPLGEVAGGGDEAIYPFSSWIPPILETTGRISDETNQKQTSISAGVWCMIGMPVSE